MSEFGSIAKHFLDIHEFVRHYIQVLINIRENSDNTLMLGIQFNGETFVLSATYNDFSHRAYDLQRRLNSLIRHLMQQKRYNVDRESKSYDFDSNLKEEMEQLQTSVTDKRIIQMIQSMRIIIDDFELYDLVQINRYSRNVIFCLLPILKDIEKQLCYISITIQKLLDANKSIIESHLKNLQEKIDSYNKNMQNKITKFIEQNVRPPALVIPCPGNSE